MTNLTTEQLKHFLKGGKFRAKYNPVKMDINNDARAYIGTEIIVHQNMIITPLQAPKFWVGQHAFNSDSIYGWMPEEDITIIEPIDDFINSPRSLPQYMYRLTYTTQEQLDKNFGKTNITLPFVAAREYDQDETDHVLNLSDPQATKIEKAVYNGESEDLVWEVIYEKQ